MALCLALAVAMGIKLSESVGQRRSGIKGDGIYRHAAVPGCRHFYAIGEQIIVTLLKRWVIRRIYGSGRILQLYQRPACLPGIDGGFIHYFIYATVILNRDIALSDCLRLTQTQRRQQTSQ